MSAARLRQHGRLFLDAVGRQVMLRGVNLGGDCKVPWPDGGCETWSDFSHHAEVSFIGRPFPLDEADEHLGRIAHWGFNIVRLLTTWEAVEHRGPGLYDEAYLDYFAEVCRRADAHGLAVLVDFHQDVWSRMTGGDGAPGWTFAAVGLDFTHFAAADAAHVMQASYDYASGEARQGGYPPMSWGANHRLPAAALMWTLFWGGRRFTPDFRIEGENVQDFLQNRYLGAMAAVARRLATLPNVIGFDTLNEPGLGWFGWPLTYRHLAATPSRPERPRIGPALSPLDGLALAQGASVTAPVLTRDAAGAAVPTAERTLNRRGVRIWRDGADCPFERAGVYVIQNGAPIALDEQAFQRGDGGRPLSPTDDAYAPFFHAVARTIRARRDDWSVFVEMDAFARSAGRRLPAGLPERAVDAGHWYDTQVLYLKHIDPTDDMEARRARYRRELGALAREAEAIRGGSPALIGEFGVPFDLDAGAAYAALARGERDGVWDAPAKALSAMYDALDAHLLHATQWNYTASNRNDPRIGDRWNQEDLSIFSRDQQDGPADPDSGGRAIDGFRRPFARLVQGRIESMRFDQAARHFRLDFDADASIQGATEVFVPAALYPDGWVVRFEGAPARLAPQPDRQRLEVFALESGLVWLSITPAADGLARSSSPRA